MEEKNGAVEIDLRKLAMYWLRRWWLIVIAALLLAAAAYAYARYYVPDKYRTSTTVFVNNFEDSSKYAAVTTSGVSTSKQLVSTYIAILKSDRILEQAVALLDGDYTVNQLKGMISASRLEDTEILVIYVTGLVPEETARIANVMGTVVTEEINKIIDGSSAHVLDTASVPKGRYSPSYRQYTMVGGAAGAVLILLILTLMFFMDVRIKDEDDLTALSDAPILGQIPEFSAAGKAPGYGEGSKKGRKNKASRKDG